MLNYKRVIDEILNVGLYDLVLQDVQRLAKKDKLSSDEVKKILEDNPELLRDYMQTSVEYNLSNIHLREIDLDTIEEKSARDKGEMINENLKTLKEIEKYTLDFAQSATLVIIFSVEFFVLFSVQYFIVLLDLKEWQWWIYGFFGLSIVAAWIYAKKEQKKYEVNSKSYKELYSKSQKLLDELERDGFISRNKLYIESCDEHI